jgi:hypothetical protein
MHPFFLPAGLSGTRRLVALAVFATGLTAACGAASDDETADATGPAETPETGKPDAVAEPADGSGKPDAGKPDLGAGGSDGKPDAGTPDAGDPVEKPDAGASDLTAALDPTLVPEVPSLPGPDDTARPTVAVAVDGVGFSFVENEVVVVDAPAAVDAFAAEVGAQILVRHPLSQGEPAAEIALLRFTPPAADVGAAATAVRALRPEAKGHLTIGSEAGAATLTAVARAVGEGRSVSLNCVLPGAGFAERTTTEHETGPGRGDPLAWGYTRDAYQWPYVGPVRPAAGSPWVGSGAGEAWRLAALAGVFAEGARVDVGIIDGGFAIHSEVLLRGRVEWSAVPWSAIGQPNPSGCGGNPCPWHGTMVAQAVGAGLDDAFGGVGSAGDVARMSYYHILGDVFGAVAAAAQAARDGQRVVNMSFTSMILPLALNWTLLPFDAALAASAGDTILVAAAGNNGLDVASGVADEEIDLLTFWPCESQSVVCIGATDWNGRRESFSNWSVSGFGVDFFAPDRQIVWDTMPDGRRPGSMIFAAGTSLSSPWVAGILALTRAAAPDWDAWQVIDVAMQTAAPGVDPQVTRMIDAEALIRRALAEGSRRFEPDDATPVVRFVSPTPSPDGGAPYGDHRFEVAIEQPGAHGGIDCCRLEWRSDPPLGQAFPEGGIFTLRLPPGRRTIEVVAINDFGLRSAPAAVTLDLRNTPPDLGASIGGLAVPGGQVVVEVRASDLNGDVFTCRSIRFDVAQAQATHPPTPEDAGPGLCRFLLPILWNYQGPLDVTVGVTDEQGEAASLTVGTRVEAFPAPLVAILQPGYTEVPYSTLGPPLEVAAAANQPGTMRWYATPLDDAYNALAGLAFLRDGDGPVDLGALAPLLDQALCLRPQGQPVNLQVDLLDGGGEVLTSHAQTIWVQCPPG